MKLFLLEIITAPVTTLRLQYAHSLASVAILAENGALPLVSVREISEDAGDAFARSGVQFGLAEIVLTPTDGVIQHDARVFQP